MTKSDVVSIEATGVDEVKRGLREFVTKASPKKAVTKATKYVASWVKENGFAHRGGPPIWGQLTSRHGGAGLEGSVRDKVTGSGGHFTGRVGSSGKKGRILKWWEGEGKTGPMKIVPRKAKFLHFFAYDGEEVFTKQVWHEPTHMFEKAAKETRPEVVRLLNDFIQAGKREARL